MGMAPSGCLAVLPGGNLIANGPFAELNVWDVQEPPHTVVPWLQDV